MKDFVKLFILLLLIGCADRSKEKVIVNPEVIETVEQNIIDTLKVQRACGYQFMNTALPTYHINDTLYKRPIDLDRNHSFEVSWQSKNDTTLIFGNTLRPDGAVGFQVEIVNDEIAILGYVRGHVLLSNLSNSPDGPMYNSIDIPTTNQKLVLSKMPKNDEKVHGYIEFKTKEFYVFENDENEQPVVDSKVQFDWKMYFKASRCGQ